VSPDWKHRLRAYLAFKPFPFNKLKTEEKISYEVNSAMIQLMLDGTYRGVFLHVPNEGRRGHVTSAVLKAIGFKAGAPDWVFIWHNGAGVIELKAPGKYLEPNQKEFKFWCDTMGVSHAVCRSWVEVFATLAAWGAL